MPLNGFPSTTSGPSEHDIRTHTTRDSQWTITTQKSPILKSTPIETMHAVIGIPIPEMIFGDNHITISHVPTGWKLVFRAQDALDMVSKTSEGMLKVAYSEEWKRDRVHHDEGIKEVVKPFDWSYSTAYKGTTETKTEMGLGNACTTSATDTANGTDADSDGHGNGWRVSDARTHPIRTDLLSRPDPIVFFDEVVLYEDELADNGIAVLSCKVRVMPERLLLLSRFYLRLDGVIVRLRDTRVYVEFTNPVPTVVRQYTAKEESYESLRRKLSAQRENVAEALRDPARVSELMTIVEDTIDVCRPGGGREAKV